MFVTTQKVLLLFFVAAAYVACTEQPDSEISELEEFASLAKDDECSSVDHFEVVQCAMHALQRKGALQSPLSMELHARLEQPVQSELTDTDAPLAGELSDHDDWSTGDDVQDNSGACLCVFDIDRTLTGKQGVVDSHCPHNSVVEGVLDNAYSGGQLTLSELSTVGIDKSSCGQCYLGLCSHGNAHGPGSTERSTILRKVLVSAPQMSLRLKATDVAWSDEPPLVPYVVLAPDGEKQHFVDKIRKWYKRQGIIISRHNTFFFDDRADNVLAFQRTGMNARQVSCTSRDFEIGEGLVGLCGATAAEIVREVGVEVCPAVNASVQKNLSTTSLP